MFFLEGDEEEESSASPSQPDQPLMSRKEGESAAHKREIQDRVNKAIRNSIKLINGLKAKDV